MAKQKGVRAGKKYGGTHTTVVPAAGMVADIAHKCDAVTKISVGFIKAGLPSAKGRRTLKIKHERGSLLLGVRDNISYQEIRVFANDFTAATTYIAAAAKEAGLTVTIVEGQQ